MPSDCFAIGFPRCAIIPSKGLLIPQLPQREQAVLFFTARIERPPLYGGGSASKKNGLPAPLILLPPRVARAKRVEGTSATFHRIRLETPARPL